MFESGKREEWTVVCPKFKPVAEKETNLRFPSPLTSAGWRRSGRVSFSTLVRKRLPNNLL
jgi:hypothetical protein